MKHLVLRQKYYKLWNKTQLCEKTLNDINKYIAALFTFVYAVVGNGKGLELIIKKIILFS